MRPPPSRESSRQSPDGSPSRLARRVTTTDAVLVGLSAMIGAGVFSSPGPAAAAAGNALLFSLVIAGVIALLNASSMAQLAALYPESGGTYVYGRRRLGPFFGFLAGWGFVIGKIASCTAMALTFGNHLWPEHPRFFAVVATLGFTIANSFGIHKTTFVARILLTVTLLALTVFTIATLTGGTPRAERLWPLTSPNGMEGVLEAAGMLFFAFAGYARLATLGEEVVEPRTTLPRAILIALGLTFLIYAAVLVSSILSVDIETLAHAATPLQAAMESGGSAKFAFVVRVGGAVASLSALISLLAGVGRTIFAMAAHRDLPPPLAHVHPQYRVPRRAEWATGLVVSGLIAFADLRMAIGFSSFAILIYYAIANAAAWTLRKDERLWPTFGSKWISSAGFLICLLIASHLPRASITGGLIVLTLGSLYYLGRALIRRGEKRTGPT